MLEVPINKLKPEHLGLIRAIVEEKQAEFQLDSKSACQVFDSQAFGLELFQAIIHHMRGVTKDQAYGIKVDGSKAKAIDVVYEHILPALRQLELEDAEQRFLLVDFAKSVASDVAQSFV